MSIGVATPPSGNGITEAVVSKCHRPTFPDILTGVVDPLSGSGKDAFAIELPPGTDCQDHKYAAEPVGVPIGVASKVAGFPTVPVMSATVPDI